MLLDGIKKSEDTITLSEKVVAYVENSQHDFARFVVCAFEINRQEFTTRNIQALGRILHTLVSGMMTNLDVKGYDADVAVIDLVALKPDKIILSISTTIYILLKTYKDKRKLTELPAPTMPNNKRRHPRAMERD
jgi:hypothetical protein